AVARQHRAERSLGLYLVDTSRRRDMMQAPAPGFKTNPDYRITFEPSPRRVRAVFNAATIADSTAAHLLFETRHLPIYYFPRRDVRFDLLRATDHSTYCPYKGTASY